MSDYHEKLKEAQRRVARWNHLGAGMEQLYVQRAELQEKVEKLERVRNKEQTDVDRLEGRSLAAFFYNVVGKMDERLDKERAEAYAAAVKYDAAARELEAVECDIWRSEAELDRLQGCEARYQELLAEALASAKAAGGAGAEELLQKEARLGFLESQQKEISEALKAGEASLQMTEKVLDKLDDAESWGTWDLLGGGLIADIAKHEALDEAQDLIELLQEELRKFQTELVDVTIQTNLQVKIEDFLRVADFIFDGLFADWTVMGKIERSKTEVQETKAMIEQVMERLEAMRISAEEEQAQLRIQLTDLIARMSI